MKGRVAHKRIFIAGIIVILLAGFVGFYFKSVKRTSFNPEITTDFSDLTRYGGGGTYVRKVTIDNKPYTEYTWDSFMLDSNGIWNGSKYIYMHDLNSSDYPNLYCVKEGTSTATTYTTVNGENDTFTLSGSKITDENYDKFYNLLASTYVWKSGDANAVNEFVKSINEKYDAQALRQALVSAFGYQNIVDKNSGKKYDILEVFIKDIQQTVIWDFTTYGEIKTRDNIVLYLRTEGYNSKNSNDKTLIGFAKDCYDYIWNSQNTDMLKQKSIDKNAYELSVGESVGENGTYSRSDIVRENNNGMLIGPVKVENPGGYNITYDVVINGETYSGNNVKVSTNASKGGSDSSKESGDVYLWVNTKKIDDGVSSITINGNVDFGEIPEITFLQSNFGQNLVNIVKSKDNKKISTTLKVGEVPEFDLRLTVNIDKVFSKNGVEMETVPQDSNRNNETQLGYRPMVGQNTLQNDNCTTEDYSTNKVPVRVRNGDVVKYHVRISNEGELDGKATKTTVYVPAGLDMLSADELSQYNITDSDYSKFAWEESVHEASTHLGRDYKKCVTGYGDSNKITKYNKENNQIQYIDLYLYCKVEDSAQKNQVLQVMAEITEDIVDEDGQNDIPDRDSSPNNEYNKIQGEENLFGTWRGRSSNKVVTDESLSIHSEQIYSGKEDDDDFESVIVDKFDLALTKQITKVKNGDNSETSYDRLKNIEKEYLDQGADSAKYIMSKPTVMVRKGSIITYKITVYNESSIDGYAKEITDYIPAGLTVCNTDGTEPSNGIVTCTGDDNATYRWEVKKNDDGSQVAVCKGLTSTVIPGYDGKELSSRCVYITCKAGENADINKVYINIAEITKYGYNVDGENSFVEASSKGVDRDSEQNSLKDKSAREKQEGIAKEHLEDAVDKSTYQNQDDDDFESVTIVSSEVDMALRVYISELDGNTTAKMETQGAQMDVTLNDEGSAMENRPEGVHNNREPKTGNESYERGIGDHKSAQYYHSKQAILAQVKKNVDYTVEIYNEGKEQDLSGIASEVTIDIPKGLTFKGFKGGKEESGTYYSSTNGKGYKATVEKDEKNGTSKLVVEIPEDLKTKFDNGSIDDDDVLDPGNTLECDKALGNGEGDSNRDHSRLTDIVVSDSEKGNIQKFTIECEVDEDADGYLTCIAEITDMYAYARASEGSSTGTVYKYNKDAKTFENNDDGIAIVERDSTPKNVDLSLEGINEQAEYQKWYFNRVNVTYVKDSYIANDDSDSPNEEDDTDFETVLVQAPVKVDITKVDEKGEALAGANLKVELLPNASSGIVVPNKTAWETNDGNQETSGVNGSKTITDDVLMRKVEGARAIYRITETVTPDGRKNVLKDKFVILAVQYTGGKFIAHYDVVNQYLNGDKANISEYFKFKESAEDGAESNAQPNSGEELNYYTNGVVSINIEVKNPKLTGKYALDILKISGDRAVSGIGFEIKKNDKKIEATNEGESHETSSESTTTGETEDEEVKISGNKTDDKGYIHCTSNITGNKTDIYTITEVADSSLHYAQLEKALKLEVQTTRVQQIGHDDCYDVNNVKLSVDGENEQSVSLSKGEIKPSDPSTSLEKGMTEMKYLTGVQLKDGKTTDIAICLEFSDQMHIRIIVNNPLKEGVYELFLQKYSVNNSNKLLKGATFNVKKYLNCTTKNQLTQNGEAQENNGVDISTDNIEDLTYTYSGGTVTHQGTLIDTVTYKGEGTEYYDYYLITETKAPDGCGIPAFFTEKATVEGNGEMPCYLIIEVRKNPSEGVSEVYAGRGYVQDGQIKYCDGEEGQKVEGGNKDVDIKYGDEGSEETVANVSLSDLEIRDTENLQFDTFIRIQVFDPEETYVSAEKVWEVETPENYKVTFKLQKSTDGTTWEDVTEGDSNTTVTKELIGNGTVTITGLKKYDNGEESSYRLIEDEDTIYEKNGENSWTKVDKSKFTNNMEADKEKEELVNIVEIGDRVAYDAGSRGEYTYQVDGNMTGDYSNSIFKSTDDLSWQVLNVDKENGTVTIMPVNPTSSQLTLRGRKGYINAKTVLDEISAVYGYGRGAQSARSITLDDVEKYSGYKTSSYSSLNSKSYNSTSTYSTGKFVEETGEVKEASSSNRVTAKQTAYWYFARNATYRNKSYDAFFRNGNDTQDKSYWLATTESYLGGSVCGYYVGCVQDGKVDGANIYISDDRESGKTFSVVPVVTLKPHIKTSGQDADGNWTLVYDDLFINTPATSISKTKVWEGIDSLDNYRATFALYKVVNDDSTEVSTIVNGEKLQLVEGQEPKTIQGKKAETGAVTTAEVGAEPEEEQQEEENKETVTYDNLKATELINGQYRSIKYKILEIYAEYKNNDTGKWNYLVKDVDYTVKDNDDNTTNTVDMKTSISFKKEWYVGIPDNYRAEYKLYTLTGDDEDNEENLTEVPDVKNIYIQGNGTGTFTNLKKYDDSKNLIKYRTKEIAIEKTSDGGKTWVNVPMDTFYRSKEEVQATTERLADKVSVGDYVAYDATSNGVYTYKAPAELAGSSKQEEFSSSDIDTWRVIRKDEDGKVYLMAETPTKQQVTLAGKIGYMNEKAVLDSIANVYAHGYGAVSARSINIEDIKLYSTYKDTNYTNLYGYKNGGKVKYSYGRFLDESYGEHIASSDNQYEVTQTACWYVAEKYFKEKYIYNAIFRNPDDTENVSYWIASPAVYTNTEVAGFYSDIVDDGKIDGGLLYSSDGEEYTKSMSTVPVVVLSENVNTDGQDARGVWTISSGTVYNEQYINQEKTQVPVKKTWNVDVLEHYKATFRLKQTINGETTYVTMKSVDEENPEVRELKDIEGKPLTDGEGNETVGGSGSTENGQAGGQDDNNPDGSVSDGKDEYYTVSITGDGTETFVDLPAYIGRTKIEYVPDEYLVQTTTDNGNTWENVDPEKYLRESNQIDGFTNLAKAVSVGDYVNYDASNGEPASYTTDAYITGSTESSTFKSTDAMKWRVLSTDGESVRLIAENPTQTMLTLSGKRGYWNAETVLNDACSVYGHGKGSVNASSINIRDISNLSTYDPNKYTNIHGIAYGASQEYTVGTFLKDGKEQSASADEKVTMDETAYWYFTQKYFKDEEARKLIFGIGENYKQYWLAGRGVYLNTEKAGFYVNQIRQNAVDGAKMFSSDKDVNSYSVGIVPVVTLQANTYTTGKDEEGAWNFIVGEDMAFVNSEITDVEATKKWENAQPGYEYRAEVALYAEVDNGSTADGDTDAGEDAGSDVDESDIVEIDGKKYAPVPGQKHKYITKDGVSDVPEEGEDEVSKESGDEAGDEGATDKNSGETTDGEVNIQPQTVKYEKLRKYKSTTPIKYKIVEVNAQYRLIKSADSQEEGADDAGDAGANDHDAENSGTNGTEGNETQGTEDKEGTGEEDSESDENAKENEWIDFVMDEDYSVEYSEDEDGKEIITNTIITTVDVTVKKTWNIDNPEKYEAVIYLQRTYTDSETGEEVTEFVCDEDGQKLSVTIRGDDTGVFKELPPKMGENNITYTVTEPEFRSVIGGELDKDKVKTVITYDTDKRGNVTATVVNSWLTNVKARKRWIISSGDDLSNYRVTFTLFTEDENGNQTEVEGVDSVIVQGNGQVVFTGVPAYKGTERIKYVIKETKVEHLDSATSDWVTLEKGTGYVVQAETESKTENEADDGTEDETVMDTEGNTVNKT